MKGTTKLILNQETIIIAIQKYFTQTVFDASQLATVKSVTPVSGYPNEWTYEVTVDSDPKEDGE